MSNKEKLTPSSTGTESSVRTPEEVALEGANVVSPQPTKAEAPTTEAKKAGRKVEIDADVLDSILKDLANLKEGQQQFEQTATQDQIRRIEALRAQGKLVKSVKIRHFDNKPMLGWRMTKNNVWVANGKLNEEQEYEVFFEDGSSVLMDITNFTRNAVYKSFEVVSEARTAAGDLMYTVTMEGGKELVINSKYVN